MTSNRRLLLAGLFAAITFASGCNRPEGQTTTSAPPVTAPARSVDAAAVARADASISQPAWLRERLPEHTVVYARIPSIWGLLSAPDGRALDAALASDQHAKIIADLRKAASNNPTLAEAASGPVLQLLLGDQSGPVEMAVIDPSDGVSPFSRALVTTLLVDSDVAALNARIAALNAGGQSPLQAPVDASGDAALQRFGALHFDVATHRLFLSLGTTASALTLQQDMAGLQSTRAHPMQDAEREIDSSGQGLFVWMSMKGLGNQLEAQMPDLPPDGLLRDAIDHMQSIAIGWGTVDGHGRLQVQVRAPQARLLGYLAPNAGEVDLKSAGKPEWVWSVALPGGDNLQAIHDHLDRDFGAGLQAKLDADLAQMKARADFDPIAFERLIGPQLVMFADANGTFAALRVTDRKALYAKLDELGQRFGWRHETVKVGDVQIHHVHAPGIDATATQPGFDPQARAWLQLYSRIGTDLYWVEDGDYLVFGQVPQALADRVASKPGVSLGEWLQHSQSYDNAHTVAGYAGTTKNLQRDVYYTYLQALQSIGNALGQSVDVSTLPSANQLGLPVDGVAGMAILANDQRLAVQVSYEQSPIEGALNGQGNAMTTVAVVAILAAIAIPAYQDYVIRSQVSEGASLAEGSKTAVAEFYSNKARMPLDNAEAGVAAPQSIAGNFVSSVTIQQGRIIVTYGGAMTNPAIVGSTLVFAPTAQANSIQWRCDSSAGTTLNTKYRPPACRP